MRILFLSIICLSLSGCFMMRPQNCTVFKDSKIENKMLLFVKRNIENARENYGSKETLDAVLARENVITKRCENAFELHLVPKGRQADGSYYTGSPSVLVFNQDITKQIGGRVE
ncbi:MAG: hypothetical protein JKY93_03765 [Gammaproteobacteria bacterium]|nr:hypothetical protein [Gammaproteobacteria bacterium]